MLNTNHFVHCTGAALLLAGSVIWTTTAQSQVLAMSSERDNTSISSDAVLNSGDSSEDRATTHISTRLQRQVVNFSTREVPGTIIVDTPHTFLYYVLGDGKAIRYGIGVGRKGFTWSGVKKIARKTEWPDWYPPPAMIARQPYLPRMMAGGPGNPLGARALYIGGTEYRIHGTNNPSSIGKRMSSGCIRLTNSNVIDLYNRVRVGAKVIVLPISSTRVSRVSSPLRRNDSFKATTRTTVANATRLRGIY